MYMATHKSPLLLLLLLLLLLRLYSIVSHGRIFYFVGARPPGAVRFGAVSGRRVSVARGNR